MLHDGQAIIVNTGGPDILATCESQTPYVAALRDCVLARFGPTSAQWVDRTDVRPALAEDLRPVGERTFASWQCALWRHMIAAHVRPFRAAARPALYPYWRDGWTVEAMLDEIMGVRQARTPEQEAHGS